MTPMHADPAYWRILNATSTTVSKDINRHAHAKRIYQTIHAVRYTRKRSNS